MAGGGIVIEVTFTRLLDLDWTDSLIDYSMALDPPHTS